MSLRSLLCISMIAGMTMFSIDGRAGDSEALFLEANRLYKEKKFQDAMNRYLKIPQPSAVVNFNLGNCAYNLGRLGYALLYFRRAQREWGFFNRGELLSNIALIKDKLRPADEKVRFAFLKAAKGSITSLLRAIPLGVLQLIFLLLWIFLFIYLKVLYKEKQKIIIVPLFFLVALFGVFLVIKYSLDSRRYAVVIRTEGKLLSGPDEKFQLLVMLPEGSEVVVTKASDGYVKIKRGSQIGWIRREFIKEV